MIKKQINSKIKKDNKAENKKIVKKIKNIKKLSKQDNTKSTPNDESPKKGFTLVELLAVIAIIAILATISVGVYNGVSKNAKQKAYESKISEIENAATKWAKENSIDKTTTISVNKLVVEGYLTADEVADNGLSKIINPTNNENIICALVEIKYKNSEIEVKYVEKSNNCSLAEQALDDQKIKVLAYEKVKNTSPTLNNNNVLGWTNQPLTLVIDSEEYDSNAISITYDYEGNSIEKSKSSLKKYSGTNYIDNPDTYYNTFNVDADIILDSNIIITYKLSDGSKKSRKINVRIDKEEATASVIAKAEWVTTEQKVIIKLDDGNGSGAKRFYIGAADRYNAPSVNIVDLCDNNNKNCKYEKEYNAPSTGEYNIWTEDMVGNISANPKNKISVNNVDSTSPTCTISFTGTKGENDWYITEVTPSIETSEAGSSGLYYGLTKGTSEDYSNYIGAGIKGTLTKTNQGETTGQTYTCSVKTLSGKKATTNSSVKVDTTKPFITSATISSKNNNYNTNQITLTIKANDQISKVKKMCILTSNDLNGCSWINYSESNNLNTNISYDNGGSIKYYIWVKDDAGLISDVKATKEYQVHKNCSSGSIINNGSATCSYTTSCNSTCGTTIYGTKTQPRKDKFTNVACDSVVTENGCQQKCSACVAPNTPNISARRTKDASYNYGQVNLSYAKGALIGNGSWSNGAEVTIGGSSTTGGVVYQYKIGDSDKEWHTYTEPLEFETQTVVTVYARAVNAKDYSKASNSASFVVKIDTTAPVIKTVPKSGKFNGLSYDSSGRICKIHLIDNNVNYPYQQAFYASDSGGSNNYRAWLKLDDGASPKCYGNFTTDRLLDNWGYWSNFYGNNKSAFNNDTIQIAVYFMNKRGGTVQIFAMDNAGNFAKKEVSSSYTKCDASNTKKVSVGGSPGRITCNSIDDIPLA